jgi:hypothetical protein
VSHKPDALDVDVGKLDVEKAELGGRNDGVVLVAAGEATGPWCTTQFADKDATRKERYWPSEGT